MPVTEFSQLKKVVVGNASMAKIPDHDISLQTVCYADKPLTYRPKSGLYPTQVIDEANEDLEKFISVLKEFGAEVVRPDYTKEPDYYYFCPRDVVLSYKDMLIATPTPIKARKEEYKNIFENPKATIGKTLLNLTCDFTDELYNVDCLQNKNILALNEHLPAFDAANILKHYDNLFYLVSNSGNKNGAKLLQEILGNSVNIHLCENMYSFMHIDSTLAILRDGLLLVNPSRIKTKDHLPQYFKNWDIIMCPEPIDVGHYPNYCASSPWCNMNLLSLDEKTVIIEERQTNLMKLLKKHSIESIPVASRHSRTLGGCWHCCTLDLERQDV